MEPKAYTHYKAVIHNLAFWKLCPQVGNLALFGGCVGRRLQQSSNPWFRSCLVKFVMHWLQNLYSMEVVLWESHLIWWPRWPRDPRDNHFGFMPKSVKYLSLMSIHRFLENNGTKNQLRWSMLQVWFGICPANTSDWFLLSRTSSVRTWPQDGNVGSPFWPGRMAPIRQLIGGNNPQRICIDMAHTYAIAGYGKEELASTLVFLAIHCSCWGPGRYECQLERAFESFADWCGRNRKTSTILDFSKKELKILSFLVWFWRSLQACSCLTYIICMFMDPQSHT